MSIYAYGYVVMACATCCTNHLPINLHGLFCAVPDVTGRETKPPTPHHTMHNSSHTCEPPPGLKDEVTVGEYVEHSHVSYLSGIAVFHPANIYLEFQLDIDIPIGIDYNARILWRERKVIVTVGDYRMWTFGLLGGKVEKGVNGEGHTAAYDNPPGDMPLRYNRLVTVLMDALDDLPLQILEPIMTALRPEGM